MLALRLFLLHLSLPKRFPKQAKLGKVLDLVGLHTRLQEVGDELFDVGRLVRLGGAVEGRMYYRGYKRLPMLFCGLSYYNNRILYPITLF